MAGAGLAGKQVASVAVERVGGATGQRYFDVRAQDGRLDRIAEGRLEWVWRLVFTSAGIGRSMSITHMDTPVTLVIAEKALDLPVTCARCGRAGAASLFRTVQRATDDVYFTRCSRCWRSQYLACLSRQPAVQAASSGPTVTADQYTKQLTSPRLRVIGTLVFLLLVAGGFYLVFKLGYNK